MAGRADAAAGLPEVRDAVLRLWYGEPGAGGRVVLRCDPIPLADIQPGG